MLTTRYKAAFNRAAEPLAAVLVKLGATPSGLTVAGLILVFASCAFLLLTHRLLAFCALAILTSLFDMLDGAVARSSGRVTKFGSYLDAVCDRYAEAAVVISVAVVTGYWVLSSVVLAGALIISYTKARAAMEAAVSNTEWPDLMERMERGVLFLVGLAASQLWPMRRPLGHDLFWWTLVVLAILIHATALQRMLRAKALIRARGG